MLTRKKVPLVSIVVIYYHGFEDYVDETLASCFSQTYPNLEIIFLNDGVTQETAVEKLAELKKKFGLKIHFIDQNNQGPIIAKNNAVSNSRGKYVCLVNPDDIIEKTYVEKLVALLEKDDKLGFASSWFKMFGQKEMLWKTPNFNLAKILAVNYIPVSSVFRRTTWEKVGRYSTDIPQYVDWELWIKIAFAGYQWAVVPEPLFLFRIREGQLSKVLGSRQAEIILAIVKKHKNKYKQYFFPVVNELLKYHLGLMVSGQGKIIQKLRFGVRFMSVVLNSN